MSGIKTCLIAKDVGTLQIPYEEYESLMEKVQEARRIRKTNASVVNHLRSLLENSSEPVEHPEPQPVAKEKAPVAEEPQKVAIEFEEKESEPEPPAPAPVAEEEESTPAQAKARTLPEGVEVPPIKKDITVHFNKIDESGRLFSVFKQYYTCLNDTCGGTVRVTMKDGFCSLWNYDEWEEFAFVDIFEGMLRVALDPRYADKLDSLNHCEVPHLLANRRELICVQVDDLNNTMLEAMVKAFKEVGMAAS